MHRFDPTRFHNTIGSHEPVLRVADGDSISTSSRSSAVISAVRARLRSSSSFTGCRAKYKEVAPERC